MRIAVIEPVPFGGLLHYATQLADALAERGNQVDLICARDNELASRSGAARRRPVLPPGAPAHSGEPTRVEATLRRARTAARLARTWGRIVREVRFGGYDAVLLNGSLDLSLTALGALTVTKLRGKTPTSHVCHNVRPFNRWGGSELFVEGGTTMKLLARAYPSFDFLFVHGERSRAEYLETYPPTRLVVIPHGDERIFEDGEEPPPPAGEPRILFFGAWRKMKGLPVLMEAFDALSRRRPDARLTIAGPPVPEEGESARVIPWASGHGDSVEVRPDYVPLEQVPDLFGRARVVVMPYLAGYQSGVVHLAMTMRRAVVASDVGDLPAAVADGETGIVVPKGDVPALVDALDRVLGDPALAERLGAAGRERVMNGSGWPTVAEQVEAALRAAKEAQ
ncbi:glycosyltransferase family 4 protein [Conexibacter sp. JD483]|uniref:glycosyltransferase family 4 protein n=1 Tax=unclassified Conexibacter TaxID=2627773 RepID=UPI002726BD1B|nr:MULTISPECIES: glycosyltransferase family 4 protein [unclassified Conexibacter]MDO8184229.1 glycosyltransferase family 4 protein [Conexibacter sp. CPCC 205706]MDO8197221.1 glycosyltransferase family 4 protein [Conexibacter sp. CPCC 205762]MDR9367464.1 glycosyltransferase family 4 protein [Conexibacter sp. JD483]